MIGKIWWGALVALPCCGVSSFSTADEAALTPTQTQGQVLFLQTCNFCHGEKGWATRDLSARLGADKALIARRKDLDPGYIRVVIRRGVGNMPAFTPTDLSREQIDSLVAYLTRANAATE